MAIKKLSSGDYQADYRDDKGVRIRKAFRLKGQAERFLRDVKDSIDNGAYISPRQSPAFQEIAEQWYREKELGVGCKKVPRPSTLSAWRIHLDRHLLPRLRNKRLDRIDAEVMEGLRDELKSQGVDGKPLAPQTVNKVLNTATAIFKLAIEKKRTKVNPARTQKGWDQMLVRYAKGRSVKGAASP